MKEEKEIIAYSPNKNYKYMAIILFVINLFPFALSLVFLYSNEMKGFWLMMMAVLFFALMIKVIADLSKLKIDFTDTALYVQHDEKTRVEEYKYDNYLYAYYRRSYKGRLYLILSQCELEDKRIKSIANLGGSVGATFYDSCAVIFIDESNKQIDIVKKHIYEKIKNVYEEG